MDTLNQFVDVVNASSPKFVFRDDLLKRVKTSNWIEGLGGHVAAARYRDCGQAGGGWVGYCPDGHQEFHAFGCMLRVCPRCAARRSRELSEKMTPALLRLVRNSSGRLSVKHIILGTNISLIDYVKFDRRGEPRILPAKLDELREQIKVLRGSVSDMLRDRFEAIGQDGCGWAIGIEFGENLILHFHVLALMPFWDQKLIGGKGGVWEKYNLHHGNYVWISELGREAEDIERGMGYVTKYVTKPLGRKTEHREKVNSANADRVEAFKARWGVEAVEAALWYVFKGVRRFQTYGAFYDLDFDAEEPVCCSECGKSLSWRPEYNGEWALFNLLKTNKSVDEVDKSPPLWVQKTFLGGWAGIDFWK